MFSKQIPGMILHTDFFSIPWRRKYKTLERVSLRRPILTIHFDLSVEIMGHHFRIPKLANITRANVLVPVERSCHKK